MTLKKAVIFTWSILGLWVYQVANMLTACGHLSCHSKSMQRKSSQSGIKYDYIECRQSTGPFQHDGGGDGALKQNHTRQTGAIIIQPYVHLHSVRRVWIE